MKGARALASGMLVLAAVCAVPAISAAQDAGTTTEATTTTTTTPAPLTPPVEPATPSDEANRKQTAPDKEPAADTAATAAESSAPSDAPASQPPASSSLKARKAASALVSIGDNFYSPASVSIAVGDTVTWRNNGQAQHSATANDGSFDTGVFGPGGSRSHTFTSAGTFSYYCTVHGQAQSGTIRVLSSSGGGSGGGGTGTSATGDSEASAVASPDAAGDANTLPMTGLAAGALALVGMALLASGLLVRRAEQSRRSARGWLSVF